MIDDLWNDFTFRTLLNDLLKAKKNEEEQKLRMEVLIGYLRKAGKSEAPVERQQPEPIKEQPKQKQTHEPKPEFDLVEYVREAVDKATPGANLNLPIPQGLIDIQQMWAFLAEHNIPADYVGVGLGAPNGGRIGEMDNSGSVTFEHGNNFVVTLCKRS